MWPCVCWNVLLSRNRISKMGADCLKKKKISLPMSLFLWIWSMNFFTFFHDFCWNKRWNMFISTEREKENPNKKEHKKKFQQRSENTGYRQIRSHNSKITSRRSNLYQTSRVSSQKAWFRHWWMSSRRLHNVQWTGTKWHLWVLQKTRQYLLFIYSNLMTVKQNMAWLPWDQLKNPYD